MYGVCSFMLRHDFIVIEVDGVYKCDAFAEVGIEQVDGGRCF